MRCSCLHGFTIRFIVNIEELMERHETQLLSVGGVDIEDSDLEDVDVEGAKIAGGVDFFEDNGGATETGMYPLEWARFELSLSSVNYSRF